MFTQIEDLQKSVSDIIVISFNNHNPKVKHKNMHKNLYFVNVWDVNHKCMGCCCINVQQKDAFINKLITAG